MSSDSIKNLENRILVLAPTGRDASLAYTVLRDAGIDAECCIDLMEVCQEIEKGAGALLVAEEALSSDSADILSNCIHKQPQWSDLPILILTAPTPVSRTLPESLAPLGNTTLLDRPLRVVTLVSAARSALRSRQRQYETRNLLDQLRDGVRQRDQFLAMLGHELRNPLATIRNAVTVLETTSPNVEPEIAEQRKLISRQGEHLARLLDDLLDVSRITAGKIVLRKKVVDLCDVVRRSAKVASADVLHHEHKLTLQVPSEPIPMNGDAVRLEQILTNLLTNAIKYTPTGGLISVQLIDDGQCATIAVTDTGIGIAPEVLPKIFDLFIQADHSLDRSQGGMGLGLTLVKNLVEMHGGQIEAHSDGFNKGSCFLVHLPVLPKSAIGQLEKRNVIPRADRATKRKILLIEDNADARKALGRLLQLWGHQVELAEDGLQGVQMAIGDKPEVALVDIGLPELDGYEVARRVREEFGKAITLVALTGYGQPEDIRRTREAGFDHHLVKPVDPPRLASLLTHLSDAVGHAAV